MSELIYDGRTDQGLVRENNEDNWRAEPAQGLYIVSDGMGGHAGGEVASKIVVEVLPPLLEQRLAGVEELIGPEAAALVAEALIDLSDRVRDESHGHPSLSGMGATVVMALVKDDKALIAHLGDSRAYRFRNGVLERLTKDHTIVQILLDTKQITPEEAAEHPARGRLTQAIGVDGWTRPDTSIVDVKPGDRFLLCSDGLTDMLDDRELARTLDAGLGLDATGRLLLEKAIKAGGKDNVTALLLEQTY